MRMNECLILCIFVCSVLTVDIILACICSSVFAKLLLLCLYRKKQERNRFALGREAMSRYKV